ncbi:MAG: glycosyltransferase, partial [Pseudomonadota bacterium]
LARRPQARFVLVGAGPLWNEAQERAKALGIDHRCLFVGATPNVGFWLSRCDAKLLLSRSEGLPNALIEAQSLAVPVVTTPAGGAPEALRHGQTGYLLSSAETLDQDEAVEIVSSLLADETRRGALGKAGQQFARQRFSTEQMVKSVLETFSGVEYGNETLCASPSPEQIARPMAQLQQLDRMAMGYARNRSLSRYAQGAVNEVRNSQAMQMGQTAFRVASKPLRWPFVWFYLIMCRLKSKPKTQGVIGAEASVFRVDRAIATAKRAAACHGPEAAYMWAVANISSPRALGRCVATIALQCRDTHPELAAALALRVKSLAPGERLLAQLSDILREQGRMSEAERLHPRRQLRLLAPSVVAAQSVAAE